MEKSELVRKYEIMLIVDSKLAEDAKQSVLKEVTDTVTKNGGKIINSRVWLDKHRLTFKINKCSEGTYFLINFEAESSVANKIKPVLRLNERVLRFVITQVNAHAPVEAVRS